MGSQSIGNEQLEFNRAFGEGFIPNMYRDLKCYPRNGTKVLKLICDCLGFGKPIYTLEKGPLARGDLADKIYQITCNIDGLMCSAVANNTEEAIYGSAFRMSVRLMSLVTFDELAAFQRVCAQPSLAGNDVTLLKQLLSLANPTCNAHLEDYRPEMVDTPIHPTNIEPFDVSIAGSTLFSLLGCASANSNENANPLLSILEPVQLVSSSEEISLNKAPVALYGKALPETSGNRSESEELRFTIPVEPEVPADPSRRIAAAIEQVLFVGVCNNGIDSGRMRNCSSSSVKSEHSATARNVIDSISRVKHYCDRHALKPSYFCVQVTDCKSPYFKADLTIDRGKNSEESLYSFGYGRTKKAARHNAAYNMLERLELLN